MMGLLPGMPHFGVYRHILADPPWPHDNFGQAKHGAAKSAYDEMPLASLCEMPVGELADGESALLFLWSTACQEADGAHLEVARAWGFRLVTRLLSWVKVAEKCAACSHPWDEHDEHLVTEDAPGPCRECLTMSKGDVPDCEQFVVRARRGPGSYTMQGVEDLWLGVRGGGWSRGEFARAERDVPEILFAPITEHSAKPDRAQDRIERLWPNAGPRLELFARRRRPGWAAWGKEAPGCDLVFGAHIGSIWPVPVLDGGEVVPPEDLRAQVDA